MSFRSYVPCLVFKPGSLGFKAKEHAAPGASSKALSLRKLMSVGVILLWQSPDDSACCMLPSWESLRKQDEKGLPFVQRLSAAQACPPALCCTQCTELQAAASVKGSPKIKTQNIPEAFGKST